MLPSAAFESSDCDASVAVTTKRLSERPPTKNISDFLATTKKETAPMRAQPNMKAITTPPNGSRSDLDMRASSPTGHGMPQSIHCIAESILEHSPSLDVSTKPSLPKRPLTMA